MIYYYLRAEGQSLGGPYANLSKTAAGLARAETKARAMGIGEPVTPWRLAHGRWEHLSPNEAEAFVANLDELQADKRPRRRKK